MMMEIICLTNGMICENSEVNRLTIRDFEQILPNGLFRVAPRNSRFRWKQFSRLSRPLSQMPFFNEYLASCRLRHYSLVFSVLVGSIFERRISAVKFQELAENPISNCRSAQGLP